MLTLVSVTRQSPILASVARLTSILASLGLKLIVDPVQTFGLGTVAVVPS